MTKIRMNVSSLSRKTTKKLEKVRETKQRLFNTRLGEESMSQYPSQASDDGADRHEQQLNERRRQEDESPIEVFQSAISNFLNYGAKDRIEAIRWFIDAEASAKNSGPTARWLKRYHTMSTLDQFMEAQGLFEDECNLFTHRRGDLLKLSLEIAEACSFSNRDKNELRTRYQARVANPNGSRVRSTTKR